jgi:heat-inducible transcriptional repressor
MMMEMELLSERQKYILGLVVRYYIETGMPIGSKTLVSDFDMDVSPATVRNELAALDEMGYLAQLHTSAGRIPSEAGYRYFVQRLLGDFALPINVRETIRHQFHQARLDLEQWMRLAAAVLARTSNMASVVTAPRPRFSRFKHVELISTQGRLVLMILVLYGGQVKQQMLTLAEPLPQARLSAAANRLNSLYEGRNLDEITARLSQLDGPLEMDVANLVRDTLRRADARSISEIYRDGLANLMEFSGARQAVRLLEERTALADIMDEILSEDDLTGVQVVIGGEGKWEELRDCSIILGRYGVETDLAGEIAVLGPTRMPYGHNISAVRYIADLMSGFVNEYYVEKPAVTESGM